MKISEELSINQWKMIAKRFGELGIFQCVISGGEPTLLKDDFFETMDILASYDVKFIFITNGMLLDEDYVNKLKSIIINGFRLA